MATISASDITKPFEPAEAYTAFGDRTPALQSFRLTFGGTDRHLGMIGVLPGGSFQDLSPDAGFSPLEIPDGQLRVYLQDRSPSGEEFQYYVAHAAVTIPGAKRYQVRSVGATGYTTHPLPSSILGGINKLGSPLVAIVGFRIFFTGGRDHHLDRIGVWFENDAIKISFSDKSVSLSDVYAYTVDFVVIPSAGLNITSSEFSGDRTRGTGGARGHITTPLSQPSNRATFMLTGFFFNYHESDHHVRDIGVVRRHNDLTVLHADNGADDPFDWHVNYAFVSPQVFVPPGPGIQNVLHALELPVAVLDESVTTEAHRPGSKGNGR